MHGGLKQAVETAIIDLARQCDIQKERIKTDSIDLLEELQKGIASHWL